MILSIEDLNYKLWRSILKLYGSNRIPHFYLLYDLIYDIDSMKAYFNFENNEIKGYILIWRGPRSYGVHLWGDSEKLITYIPTDRHSIIHLYNLKLLDKVVNYLKNYGEVSIHKYLDMVVDSKTFKAYMPDKAVKIDEGKIGDFIDIKRTGGTELSIERARNILDKWQYYGLYVDNLLVSIACCYLKMRDIWAIGDVYTRPEYRGRGYAKIVTSAVTRDAINSGAIAVLHVRADNLPAIRVYRKLGYTVIAERIWIIFKPK